MRCQGTSQWLAVHVRTGYVVLQLQLSPDISVDLFFIFVFLLMQHLSWFIPERFVSCSHNLAKADGQGFFSTKSLRDPDIRSIKFQQAASMVVPAGAEKSRRVTHWLSNALAPKWQIASGFLLYQWDLVLWSHLMVRQWEVKGGTGHVGMWGRENVSVISSPLHSKPIFFSRRRTPRCLLALRFQVSMECYSINIS